MRTIVGLTQTRSLPFLLIFRRFDRSSTRLFPSDKRRRIYQERFDETNHVRRRDASSIIYHEDTLRSLSIVHTTEPNRQRERDREGFDLPHRSAWSALMAGARKTFVGTVARRRTVARSQISRCPFPRFEVSRS